MSSELAIAQLHREFVDGHALAAFEDVDADDVALDRTDARRHEAERTRPVGEPDADEDTRRIVHEGIVRAKMTGMFRPGDGGGKLTGSGFS